MLNHLKSLLSITLKSLWDARESADSACQPGFYNWFVKHKVDLLKSSALCPVWIEAGLGNPPKLFTTNASESLNAVIKSKVNYEKSELGKFIDKMRSLTIDQQQEVERAACCRGKYKLRPQYKFLEVSQQRWFAMTPEAHNKHMAKVNSATLIFSDSITDFLILKVMLLLKV